MNEVNIIEFLAEKLLMCTYTLRHYIPCVEIKWK